MSDIVKSEENDYGDSPGKDGTWKEWIEYVLYLYKYGGPKSKPEMIADLIQDVAEMLGWHETTYEVTHFYSTSVFKWPTTLMLATDNTPTNILPTDSIKKKDLDTAIRKLQEQYTIADIAKVKTYKGSFQEWSQNKNDWKIQTRAITPTEEFPFSCEIKLDYEYLMENGNMIYNMRPGLKFIVTLDHNKYIRLRLYYHAQGKGGDATAYSVCCIPTTRLYLSIRAGKQVSNNYECVDLQPNTIQNGKCDIFWSKDYSQINYAIKFDAHHYDQAAESDGITGDWGDYTEIVNIPTSWVAGFEHFKNNETFYFDFSSVINYYRKRVDAQ